MKLAAFIVFLSVSIAAHAQVPASKEQFSQAAKHCTIGDVTSDLQAFEIGLYYASGFPGPLKVAGLGGSLNCQYRFFLTEKPNGNPWEFCEDELFLGGAVVLLPYVEAGLSRQEAVEELDRLGSILYFGPVSGAISEQSLVETNDKEVVLPDRGNTVYTQDAFITQQPPGTYLSSWTQTFDGAPQATIDVLVHVVTHAEHLARVEAGTWRQLR